MKISKCKCGDLRFKIESCDTSEIFKNNKYPEFPKYLVIELLGLDNKTVTSPQKQMAPSNWLSTLKT